jgi:hypothetical protein
VTGSAWRLVTGKIVFRIRKIRRRKMPGPETRKASLRRPVFFSVQKKEDVFLIAPAMPNSSSIAIKIFYSIKYSMLQTRPRTASGTAGAEEWYKNLNFPAGPDSRDQIF